MWNYCDIYAGGSYDGTSGLTEKPYDKRFCGSMAGSQIPLAAVAKRAYKHARLARCSRE